jgi:hypothetical protein
LRGTSRSKEEKEVGEEKKIKSKSNKKKREREKTTSEYNNCVASSWPGAPNSILGVHFGYANTKEPEKKNKAARSRERCAQSSCLSVCTDDGRSRR